MGAEVLIPFYVPPKLSDSELSWVQARIRQVLESGQITNEAYVRRFEDRVREIHKVEHVIACSSCTQALMVALEVFQPASLMVQAFTWKSIQHVLPLRPVTYCDINSETWLPEFRVRSSWDFLPKLVIYTHTFGNIGVASYDVQDQRLIYDGAYSLGADLPDIGDATIISTTATKTVTSCEGGLILTNNSDWAKQMTEVRDKCSRMSELNAIVGLAYLDMLKQILARKKAIFEYYSTHLPFKPQKLGRWGTTYGMYGCLVPNRDKLIKKLEKVETRIRYEPLKKGLPVTESIANQVMILPCYPDVEEREVVRIIKENLS